MLRKSKTVLKAMTMGALLVNGGVGTEGEEDKQKKDLNIPFHNAVVNGSATEGASEASENGGGDIYRSLIEPHASSILSRVDERAEMRRALLRKPIKVDLRGEPMRGVLPFYKVLNTLLVDAKKYDVPLNLTLVNATQAELDEILNHENAQFIKDLDWNYDVPLIDDMDAYDWLGDEAWTEETVEFTPTPEDSDEEWIEETIEFTPTPEDSDEEWIEETVEFTPTPEDSDEEWIDDPIRVIKDDPEEDWIYDLLGFMRDDAEEEGGADLLRFMRDDAGEARIDPAGVVRAGPLVPRMRRAVARARYMPVLGQLIDDFGQKGIMAPPQKVVVNKDISAKENNNLQLSSWSMTPTKAAEKNGDPNSQDSDQFSNLTRHASHHLVHIFCRGN